MLNKGDCIIIKRRARKKKDFTQYLIEKPTELEVTFRCLPLALDGWKYNDMQVAIISKQIITFDIAIVYIQKAC